MRRVGGVRGMVGGVGGGMDLRGEVWVEGWADREGKGGVRGCEAYEAKKKRENLIRNLHRRIF